MNVEKSLVIEPAILKRPDFGPTHVKTLDEIKVGKTFIDRHEISQEFAGGRFTVTEPPYKNGKGWCVRGELEAPYLEEKTTVEWSLADHGVVPYPDRTWNRSSWIEDPEEALPVEEILTQ